MLWQIGSSVSKETAASMFRTLQVSSNLKARETAVPIRQTAQHHNPQNKNLQLLTKLTVYSNVTGLCYTKY
jgi:hypothetical protein